MTGKADFTKDEWRVLMDAPNAAAIAVVLTDLAGREYVEEVAAIVSFIQKASTRYPDNPLVQDVVGDMLAPDGGAATHQEEPECTKPQQLGILTGRLKDAARVLEDKGGEQARGFKLFLHDLAVHVAEAGSEDVHGKGENVSDKERAYLEELKIVLKL